MVVCSLRYGSSFVDYFNFRFYEKEHEERRAYATMGFMYEFQKCVNARGRIDEVDNKVRFAENFAGFCIRPHIFLAGQQSAAECYLMSRVGSMVVLKDPVSTAGKGVHILEVQ